MGWDLLGQRIPNRLCLLLAAGGVVGLFGAAPWQWLDHLGTATGLLLLGFILFLRGVWGGGDAKFLAVIGLWRGSPGLPGWLLLAAMMGGVLAGAFWLLRHLSRRRPERCRGLPLRWLRHPGVAARIARLPYGVALGGGALLLTGG